MHSLVNAADNGYLKTYALGLPEAMGVVALMLLSIFTLWFARNVATPFNDHAEIRARNGALAIERAAFSMAQMLAMTFAIRGFDSTEMAWSLMVIAGKFLFITIAMLLLGYVVDWAILPGIKNDLLLLRRESAVQAALKDDTVPDHCQHQNYAVAIAMAGAYLGLGWILGNATTGSAATLAQSVASTIVFALLGLAVMIVVVRLHVRVTHRSYNLHDELEKGNIVPAIDLAALALSMSLLVGVGVAGDIVGWWDAFKAFGATVTISLGLQYGLQWAVNRYTYHATSYNARHQQNTAVMTLVACGRVGLAMLLATVVANVL